LWDEDDIAVFEHRRIADEILAMFVKQASRAWDDFVDFGYNGSHVVVERRALRRVKWTVKILLLESTPPASRLSAGKHAVVQWKVNRRERIAKVNQICRCPYRTLNRKRGS
jgi:hypothetical protein